MSRVTATAAGLALGAKDGAGVGVGLGDVVSVAVAVGSVTSAAGDAGDDAPGGAGVEPHAVISSETRATAAVDRKRPVVSIVHPRTPRGAGRSARIGSTSLCMYRRTGGHVPYAVVAQANGVCVGRQRKRGLPWPG
jgi:hypothetical protein